jgi:hypothetical protein
MDVGKLVPVTLPLASSARAPASAQVQADPAALQRQAIQRIDEAQGTPLPFDPASRAERAVLLHLTDWKRVYGATVVCVKSEVRPGLAGAVEWTDAYLKRAGDEPVNLSRCDGVPCGQPSLSHHGRLVAFVRFQP